MRKIAKTSLLAAVAAATFGGLAAPAQATCYVHVTKPTGLGVCASVKNDPTYGLCFHAEVYTDVPAGDPGTLYCPLS